MPASGNWAEKIEALCRDPRYNRENPNDPRNVLTEHDMRAALTILKTTALSPEEIYDILLHGGEEIGNAFLTPADSMALQVPGNPAASLIAHAQKIAERYSAAACEQREIDVEAALERWGDDEGLKHNPKKHSPPRQRG